MSNNQTIQTALPVVLSMMGEAHGVNVKMGDYETASTDGKSQIYIPFLPKDSRRAAVLAYGFGDHEIGHIRYTDMSFFEIAARKSTLAKSLLNGLEDTRIDAKMMLRFPGVRQNRLNLEVELINSGFYPEVQKSFAHATVLQGVVLLFGRAVVLGFEILTSLYAAFVAEAESRFGVAFVGKLIEVCARIRTAKSTQDAWEITQAILEMIEKESEPDGSEGESGSDEHEDASDDLGEDQSSSSAGNGDEDGAEDESEGGPDEDAADESEPDGSAGESGSDEREDASDDLGEDQSSSSAGNGDEDGAEDESEGGPDEDAADESEPDGSAGESGSDEREDASDDLGEDQSSSSAGNGDGEMSDTQRKALSAVLNASSFDLMDDMSEVLSELLEEESRKVTSSDIMVLPSTFTPDQAPLHDLNEEKVRRTTQALRTRMRSLMQAQTLQRVHPRRIGRHLDTRVLARTAVGDLRVFRGRVEKKGIDTAVLLLLDKSGSMVREVMDGSQRSLQDVANESCLAIKLAMDSLPQLHFGLAAFPFRDNGVLRVLPISKSKIRTTRLGVSPCGGTPLADALLWSGKELCQVDAARRVCIVLTDGEPDDVDSVLQNTMLLERSGIELCGIGIMHPDKYSLFSRFRRIDDVLDLPKALFGMLQDILLQK